ncbi:MAG TPA: uroporphyrinogen-III C-methyltransferase [Pyrinomonadaceae bacterium]|nr:uroporphyrinogen-III C-methyltransferase [Pyrinomonadaceae bacterium]
MKGDPNIGILVVGHGSRRREANDDVRQAAERIGLCGSFPIVEAAFLEIEQPSIREAIVHLVQRGVREIIVHPYFLSPGRHTRGDIPFEVQESADAFPGITFRISEPLSAHPQVISASVERIRETIHDTNPAGLGKRVATPGTVYLVGAGPGDPELLTVRAHQLLRSCDVVIYDYLVNPDILNQLPSGIERIYVGKIGGGSQTPQSEINSLLIACALKGQRVVRLKGGDPFLFGRGAEEAEVLQGAGIPFQVVPGISSALAVPAYAGIPLTHRGYSSSVTIITGASGASGNYQAVNSAAADTLVILMGIKHLQEIAMDLIANGRSAETPVAIIRWGSYEGQETLTGTLRSIGRLAQEEGVRAPAVIVIGEVVKLRERLQWFEETLSPVREELVAV